MNHNKNTLCTIEACRYMSYAWEATPLDIYNVVRNFKIIKSGTFLYESHYLSYYIATQNY